MRIKWKKHIYVKSIIKTMSKSVAVGKNLRVKAEVTNRKTLFLIASWHFQIQAKQKKM